MGVSSQIVGILEGAVETEEILVVSALRAVGAAPIGSNDWFWSATPILTSNVSWREDWLSLASLMASDDNLESDDLVEIGRLSEVFPWYIMVQVPINKLRLGEASAAVGAARVLLDAFPNNTNILTVYALTCVEADVCIGGEDAVDLALSAIESDLEALIPEGDLNSRLDELFSDRVPHTLTTDVLRLQLEIMFGLVN